MTKYTQRQLREMVKDGLAEDITYGNNDTRKQIEEACNNYFQKIISEYLYKTAKEYNSDIDGFGRYAVKYFVTLQDWDNYNWLDNYQNSTFNVEVDSKVKSGYTFL